MLDSSEARIPVLLWRVVYNSRKQNHWLAQLPIVSFAGDRLVTGGVIGSSSLIKNIDWEMGACHLAGRVRAPVLGRAAVGSGPSQARLRSCSP